MKTKKTIFLTGATGNMGREVLRQLLERSDRFNITVLVLPTKKDKKIMAAYEHLSAIKIIWGDLTNYTDVLTCVNDSDYVLHVGGMVSPMADYQPELTTKVNLGSIRNIIKAIQAQIDPNTIKLIYIGTVAQTGDRNPPIHWGRAGDPIKISVYDNYAITKTIAEREVIESGLKYWVSLRQTGMLYHGIFNMLDPIMFHEPLNGVFEWVTAKDSGRLLANACEEEVPEEFWRRIYNIGGGERYRTTNLEFMDMTFEILGITNIRKVTESNWFATKNFHGQWYEDSDILESYLHYRSGSVVDFLNEFKSNLPLKLRISKYIPSAFIKKFVMRPIAYSEHGTMYWIKNNIKDRISAFFGSKEKWEQIPDWENLTIAKTEGPVIRLNHGYDENKPTADLELNDMIEAARFRGGKCMSPEMKKGDLATKLKWSCAFDHDFEASPTLILLGGHWCPDCLPSPWNYEEEAKRNPFFEQVWKFTSKKENTNNGL